MSTKDGVWMERAEFNQLTGGALMTETMWRCDQVRAGQLYNRMLFDTREEAMHLCSGCSGWNPTRRFRLKRLKRGRCGTSDAVRPGGLE